MPSSTWRPNRVGPTGVVRALKDADARVAGDAARALGRWARELALQSARSPRRCRTPIRTSHLRGGGACVHRSEGGRGDHASYDPSTIPSRACDGRRARRSPASARPRPHGAAVDRGSRGRVPLRPHLCGRSTRNIGPEASPALHALNAAANDPALRTEAKWAIESNRRRRAGRAAAHPAARPPPPRPSPHDTAPPGNPARGLGHGHRAQRPVERRAGRRNVTAGPWLPIGIVYIGTDNAQAAEPGVQRRVRRAPGLSRDRRRVPLAGWRPARRARAAGIPPSVDDQHSATSKATACTTSPPNASCAAWIRAGSATARTTALISTSRSGTTARPTSSGSWTCAHLGVFPHEACNSEVLPVGDLLFVCTSNGRNEGHTRVPSPRAPSLIAVDKRIRARSSGARSAPGENVLHGQWSSPAAARRRRSDAGALRRRRRLVRAYDAASGRELWRFDGNPKDAWRPRPASSRAARSSRRPLPGRRPGLRRHGRRPVARRRAVVPARDQSERPRRRHRQPAPLDLAQRRPRRGHAGLHDGLLYVGDLGGNVHCVDAATGAPSGSTTRTGQSGDACCSPAAGSTSATSTAT